jgi:hypothetical protein
VKAALAAAAAVVLAFPVAASANGDPASDVLLVNTIYFPAEGVTDVPEREAKQALAAAKSRGYTIRLALIATKTDLGLVPGLFRKPRQYAEFLWKELSFSYRGRLLVVMPNGFGFYAAGGKGVDEAQAKLKKIAIGDGSDAVTHAGASGIRVLAGLKPLPPLESGDRGGGSNTTDRILIGIGGALLLAALSFSVWRLVRRPRTQGASQ